MDQKLKIPPKNRSFLTSPADLAKRLSMLIGREFTLTRKSRTDGSTLRKLVASTLLDGAPESSPIGNHEIIPEKGVPKILLEYIDTYIVTTGTSYNLQVWNRNPASDSVQIKYNNGDTLSSNDVRFVLVKIGSENNLITAVAVLTPNYITDKFGRFGKPTLKYQLIISGASRKSVLELPKGLLFHDEELNFGGKITTESIQDSPTAKCLLPLSQIKKIVEDKIIGAVIPAAATKNRGQYLERLIATELGYIIKKDEFLAGGYPDIRNQALEVKLQDSPTVDLGMYTPEYEEQVPECGSFTTLTMRYFIAFTNPISNVVEGGVLCTGGKLGQHFTYVADKSYKCQRSIPMAFFDGIIGQSVFNPKAP
jgi:hypothetical protein